MDLGLPPGFVFSPTDQELLTCFLKPKVHGERLPWYNIEEKEIYGPYANPWKVFDDLSTSWIISDEKPEKITYVFVKLTDVAGSCTGSGVRKDRKAGCGTWQNGTGPKDIRDTQGKNIIGYKRMFVFGINDLSGLGNGIELSQLGYWKMHEFSLRGCKNYVICRITFDKSKDIKIDCKVGKKTVTGVGDEAVMSERLQILRGSEKIVAPMQNLSSSASNHNIIQGVDCNRGLGNDNQGFQERGPEMLPAELARPEKELDEALAWSAEDIEALLKALNNDNVQEQAEPMQNIN